MSTNRPNSDQVEFTLPKQGYAAFDAASLKQLITERLNSNSVFTDQNYEGSNINAFIDVVSYAYHVLLFYLNNTSNESLFSEAQIYENINRIVKSIDYKPIGTQAPVLSIETVATDQLLVGTYTIPRYSYIDVRGYRYSFNQDVTFVKSSVDEEPIVEMYCKTLLYQGNYKEYPEYVATGEPNELLTIVPGEDVQIDHFNIDVYVLEGGDGGSYYKYDVTTSLFFERPTTRRCEIRLNENKRYEVKFGNDVNGRKLVAGDKVYVYYLATDGTAGEIEANVAVRKNVVLFKSNRLDDLKESTNIKGDGVVYMDQLEADRVLVSNPDPTTKFYTGETVEDIRVNAPDTFSAQYRLVSITDYENYIRKNYSNFVSDVKGIDNPTYLDTHIKYYYDLGMKHPNLESRVLLNQVQFSSSCNFNNLYLYCVPRLEKTTSETQRNNYLTTAQKEVIINQMAKTKTVTCDPIVMDPVYVAANIGYRASGESLDTTIPGKTGLMLVQEDSSRANSNDIIQRVVSIFRNYFNTLNSKIGMTIDVTTLTNDILSIQGITTFYTYRPDLSDVYVEGLSMMVWNPIYDTDIVQTTQNYKLPVFKFPYFDNIEELGNRISVYRLSDAISVLRTSTSGSTSVAASDIQSNTSTDTSSSSTSTDTSSSSTTY